MEKKVFVVKSTTKRDVLIGVIVGVIVLGLLALAIYSLSSRVTDAKLSGKIIAKHFMPQPEEQVTVGSGGLVSRKLDGEYTLEVHVDSEQKDYTVWVDKTVYETHAIGDTFYFMRPLNEHR